MISERIVMYEIFEKLLIKHGVTAYRVSKETGITTATLTSWKQGKYTPKREKLQKIADYFGVSIEYLMTGKEDIAEKETILTSKDEKDIAKDLDSLMNKLRNSEDGPASYDGEEIPEADLELFAGQVELMLRRLKAINKEKYNPNKNKK